MNQVREGYNGRGGEMSEAINDAIKIRRSWGNTKPWTKIKQNGKLYDRKKTASDLRRCLNEIKRDREGKT